MLKLSKYIESNNKGKRNGDLVKSSPSTSVFTEESCPLCKELMLLMLLESS